MRTHGWSNNPPQDDVEARQRIIDATIVCVDRFGAQKTTLSDVATEVGITRKTLYRYFPNMETLLAETGLSAANKVVTDLVGHVMSFDDPADRLVEAICFAIEELPKEPYAGLLITGGRADLYVLEATNERAKEIGRAVMEQILGDLDEAFEPGTDIDGSIEICLRILASLVMDPGAPRTKRDLRTFVRRWMIPSVGLRSAPSKRRARKAG